MTDFEKENKLTITIINRLDDIIRNSDIVNIILEYLEHKVNFADVFVHVSKCYHKSIVLLDPVTYYESTRQCLKLVKVIKLDSCTTATGVFNMNNMRLLTNAEYIDFSGYFGYDEFYHNNFSVSIFEYCKNLMYLNISSSIIEILPNNLPRLQELNCENNKNIKFIPYFRNLKILNIRNTSDDLKLDDKYYANDHKVMINHSDQKNDVNASGYRILMFDLKSDLIRFS